MSKTTKTITTKSQKQMLDVQKEMEKLGIVLEMPDSEKEDIVPVDILEDKLTKSIRNFNELLDGLESTEARKKVLWKQIFEYALIDRKNAYLLFSDLYNSVIGSSAEHAIHGQTLSKYLERMSKANDQLIKLAEIVDEEVQYQQDEVINEENLYDQMLDGK